MPGQPSTVGRFRILHLLGAGGMAVVYAAFDDQLQRQLAIKILPHAEGNAESHHRFLHEARVAASLNHPNVCQVYEVGDHDGCSFLAMELLHGEPLSVRLARGRLELREAADYALALLSALAMLHERGVVHRDVKPSNLFLTAHGLKLLDFGIASRLDRDPDGELTSDTVRGAIVGTPTYMAPEQALGDAVDARADLFAVGLLLFEMLTGRRAFAGGSALQVMHAIAYETAPALDVPGADHAIGSVIRRALEKKPADRYANATAMATDLRAAIERGAARMAGQQAVAKKSLIVLPFRILRSDPDTDFLSFSLPDAITTTLSEVQSLAVRSSLTAARFKDAVDLKQVAAEAGVDVVLTGTFLKAGDRLRLTTQLVEMPGEAVIWSDTADVAAGDIFRLQDELTRRIVDSLAVPLTPGDRVRLKRDVPASALAYELYLRANQLSQHGSWTEARDTYLKSLAVDERYAPAWGALGRTYRLLGKYGKDRQDVGSAEAALQRAVALNPDLALAHYVYAQIDVDRGRAEEAMVRMLNRAQRHGADPQILAALVHACRYCGLLDASVAAHLRATRLDPTIDTSVMHSYWLLGRYEDVLAVSTVLQAYVFVMSLAQLGRRDDALEWIAKLDAEGNRLPAMVTAARLLIEGRGSEGVAVLRTFSETFSDPEGLYYMARHAALVGDVALAMSLLERAVSGGYFCYAAMVSDPWLDSLRALPGFYDVLHRSQTGFHRAAAAFVAAGGPEVLGVSAAL